MSQLVQSDSKIESPVNCLEKSGDSWRPLWLWQLCWGPWYATVRMDTKWLKAHQEGASWDRFKLKCILRDWWGRFLGAFACVMSFKIIICPISQETVQVTGPLEGEGRRRVEPAIRKMHVNLGHASTDDRILRHHAMERRQRCWSWRRHSSVTYVMLTGPRKL